MISLLLVALILCNSLTIISSTPLDDYVKKPDSTYKYEDTGYKVELVGYTAYFINMTSQTWLTGNHTLSHTNHGVLLVLFA